jgi:activator of HSP90 ATPase
MRALRKAETGIAIKTSEEKMNGGNGVTAVGSAPTRRQMICGAAITLTGMALVSGRARAGDEQGISRTAEAIHQEPVFKASRKRVYEALTDAKQFDKVVQMSEAMKSMTAAPKNPTQISREVGGEFSLFGGYITGRHIELTPGERIVQAWRAGSWDPHVYSIVRFELTEDGAGTKIVFDHTGFPVGQAEHLAGGWKGNYWEPLEKFLARAEMK